MLIVWADSFLPLAAEMRETSGTGAKGQAGCVYPYYVARFCLLSPQLPSSFFLAIFSLPWIHPDISLPTAAKPPGLQRVTRTSHLQMLFLAIFRQDDDQEFVCYSDACCSPVHLREIHLLPWEIKKREDDKYLQGREVKRWRVDKIRNMIIILKIFNIFVIILLDCWWIMKYILWFRNSI